MTARTAARLGLLACIWGSSFLFIKVALEAFAPSQVMLGRLVAGSLALGAVVVARREPVRAAVELWPHLLFAAVVANVVPFFLFAWGEQRVTSGMAGVMNGTTPLFTLVVAMLALPEERPTRARLLGLVIGFAGAVVVVAPWRSDGTSRVSGQLACMAAAAAYGVSFVYMRRHLSNRGRSPIALSFVQISIATAIALVVVPFMDPAPTDLAWRPVAALCVLGAVGTGAAYLLNYALIREAGATTTSMVTYLMPVVAVALGVIVLAEPIHWTLFAGAAVVIVGVLTADERLRRPTRPRTS